MTYTVDISKDLNLSLNEPDLVASVLQNIAIILKTTHGSCPMFRNFGLPQDHVGLPIPAAQQLLVAEIKTAIEEFEPRASVISVTFSSSTSSPTGVVPIVEVEINAKS